MKGFATEEGTKRYKDRFSGKLNPAHFRSAQNLYFSSIGIGSYLGEPDDATDILYEASLKEAVRSGINVIDTAINYRCQRSERSFGNALAELFKSGEARRDEVIVCTKAGFIPYEGHYPPDAEAYIEAVYIGPGIVKAEDISQGCHSLAPSYLEDQLSRSLKNLRLETIDIFYLHNPETQLAEIPRDEFLNRMRAAFKWAEEKVAEGKIKMYGTATWNGYRVQQKSKDHLSVEELLCAARETAGQGHHFKAVQLPFNLAMPEAWIAPTQPFAANSVPLLGIAHRLDLVVIASASLLQSRLTGKLPEHFDRIFHNLPKSSQRSIQFTRSAPSITTALVGMKNKDHVRENLETAKVPALTETELINLFQQE